MIWNLTIYPGCLNRLENSYLSRSYYHLFHSSVPQAIKYSVIFAKSLTQVYYHYYYSTGVRQGVRKITFLGNVAHLLNRSFQISEISLLPDRFGIVPEKCRKFSVPF